MTSTIKVDNIQNQCGANIINESANTITIGASGDTIALASGASQSGFGRTGTVDWQTGSIKTATFTAANGEGYFCNTTSSGFTVNLPIGIYTLLLRFRYHQILINLLHLFQIFHHHLHQYLLYHLLHHHKFLVLFLFHLVRHHLHLLLD